MEKAIDMKSCLFLPAMLWLLTVVLIMTDAVKVTVVEPKHGQVDIQTLARVHVVAQDGNGAFPEQNIEDRDEYVGVLTKEERVFRPLPFPVDFQFYDVNKDGQITLRELIEITGRAENVQKAFAASDENGDGKVTIEEYDRVPWGYNPNDVVLQ